MTTESDREVIIKALYDLLHVVTNIYIVQKVVEVVAYPGVRSPAEALKATAGVGGWMHGESVVDYNRSGFHIMKPIEVKLTWKQAVDIILEEGLLVRAILEHCPNHVWAFAKNREVKKRATEVRHILSDKGEDLDLTNIPSWNGGSHGKVQRRNRREHGEGRTKGRGEVPYVRE